MTLGSLLKPYPQYTAINQTNTDGKQLRTHTAEIRAQRPFRQGLSFMVAYAWDRARIQQWFDDLATYKTLQSGGDEGWTWLPVANSPTHRFTAAATAEIPVGRGRKYGTDMPTALDLLVGGWQYTISARLYSGRPLLFGTSYNVSGDPKLDNPTRDQWFDTTKFSVLSDTNTPRTNPWYYDGLNGPGAQFVDMTLTKSFTFGKYRLETRLEAYNALNTIVWENPDLTISSSNFGKVTRKRTDGLGREIQFGLRFVF